MNRYKAHQILIKKVKLKICSEIKGARIFDHTVGLFYTRNGSPVKVGTNGMSDCFVLVPSKNGLLYISLEFKTGNATQRKDQKDWQNFIEKMGGLYLIVREDTDSCINQIKEYLKDKV